MGGGVDVTRRDVTAADCNPGEDRLGVDPHREVRQSGLGEVWLGGRKVFTSRISADSPKVPQEFSMQQRIREEGVLL